MACTRVFVSGAHRSGRWVACALTLALGCAPAPVAPDESGTSPAIEVPGSAASPLPERPLTLGRPPHLADSTVGEYRPLARYLSQALGHPVELRVTTSYREVVDRLVAGELDFALLTPLTYVEARERLPDLRLLASLLGEGASHYRGYVVVPQSATTTTLAELRGARFAFVDRSSASGHLFVAVLLRRAGLDPEHDFGQVSFLGSHRAVAEALLQGRADAGAISSTTYRHEKHAHLQGRLRIIAKSDSIPLDGLVAHPSVPDAACRTVQQAVVGLSTRTSEGRQVLQGITTINGFVFAQDRDYDPVRAALRELAQPRPAGAAEAADQRPVAQPPFESTSTKR